MHVVYYNFSNAGPECQTRDCPARPVSHPGLMSVNAASSSVIHRSQISCHYFDNGYFGKNS